MIAFKYVKVLKAEVDKICEIIDTDTFDHIYTDEEMYRRWGITDEERKVIEDFITYKDIDSIQKLFVEEKI